MRSSEKRDLSVALSRSRRTYREEQNESAELEAVIQESIRFAEREALGNDITDIISIVKPKLTLTATLRERASKALEAGNDAKAAMQAVSRCWRPQQSNYCGWHAVDVVLCVLGLNPHISRGDFETQMMPESDPEIDARRQLYDEVGYSGDALINVLQKNAFAGSLL